MSEKMHARHMLYEAIQQFEQDENYANLVYQSPSHRVAGYLEEFAFSISLTEEATPAIYFLFRGPELVYIGQSKDVLIRLLQHQGRLPASNCCHRFDRAFFLHAPEDEKARMNLEKHFIRVFRPKLNRGKPVRWRRRYVRSAWDVMDFLKDICRKGRGIRHRCVDI